VTLHGQHARATGKWVTPGKREEARWTFPNPSSLPVRNTPCDVTLLPRLHPTGACTNLGPVGHGESLQASRELIQGFEPQFPACFLGTLVLEIGTWN
jgi:hypothetical protein